MLALTSVPDPPRGFRYKRAAHGGDRNAFPGVARVMLRAPFLGEWYVTPSGSAQQADRQLAPTALRLILEPELPPAPAGFRWALDSSGMRIRRKPYPFEWFMSEGRPEGDRPLCDSDPKHTTPQRYILDRDE